jgi:hypothetical protein
MYLGVSNYPFRISNKFRFNNNRDRQYILLQSRYRFLFLLDLEVVIGWGIIRIVNIVSGSV